MTLITAIENIIISLVSSLKSRIKKSQNILTHSPRICLPCVK